MKNHKAKNLPAASQGHKLFELVDDEPPTQTQIPPAQPTTQMFSGLSKTKFSGDPTPQSILFRALLVILRTRCGKNSTEKDCQERMHALLISCEKSVHGKQVFTPPLSCESWSTDSPVRLFFAPKKKTDRVCGSTPVP